jgi:hypothetical protein
MRRDGEVFLAAIRDSTFGVVLPLGFSPQSFGDTAGGGNTKLSTCALLFGVTFLGVTTVGHVLSNRGATIS